MFFEGVYSDVYVSATIISIASNKDQLYIIDAQYIDKTLCLHFLNYCKIQIGMMM